MPNLFERENPLKYCNNSDAITYFFSNLIPKNIIKLNHPILFEDAQNILVVASLMH